MKTTELNFNKESTSQGRNGTMRTTGIELANTGKDVIISPINSKGQIGNCYIGIPLEDAHQLFDALKAVLF